MALGLNILFLMKNLILALTLLSASIAAAGEESYRACVMTKFRASVKDKVCDYDGQAVFGFFSRAKLQCTTSDLLELLTPDDLAGAQKKIGQAQALAVIDVNNYVNSQRDACGQQRGCSVDASSCSQTQVKSGENTFRSSVGTSTK